MHNGLLMTEHDKAESKYVVNSYFMICSKRTPETLNFIPEL